MDPITLAMIMGGTSLGGNLLSGLFGSSAQKDASNEQAQAAANALAFQKQQLNTTQGNIKEALNFNRNWLAPYNSIGTNAIGQLGNLYGMGNGGHPNFNAFTQSPDYQFAKQQGDLALQRQGAASGGLLSGGQLKAGEQFGQGLASQQFGNYFNRLYSLATVGANAASNQGSTSAGLIGSGANATTQQANNIATTGIAQGNYQAGGILGSAGQLTSIFPNSVNTFSSLSNLFKNNYSPNTFAGNNPQSGNSAYWTPKDGLSA